MLAKRRERGERTGDGERDDATAGARDRLWVVSVIRAIGDSESGAGGG